MATLATPGLQAAFESLVESGEIVTASSSAPVGGIARANMPPLVCPLASLAPTHLPAFPYHELSYSTLKDLLNHINSMHEDAEAIADAIQGHHISIAYHMIDTARRASTMSTALLLHDLKGINYWLKNDARERKSLRSGAQHMGFLTTTQLEMFSEAKALIIAELKSSRHLLREGGAFLDKEDEDDVEDFGAF
jgi:hypothetical protein